MMASLALRIPTRYDGVAGIRDRADRRRRRTRILTQTRAMADRSPAKVAELIAFLDQWIIVAAGSTRRRRFLPTPGWDDEGLHTRVAYSTFDEAKTAVAARGAKLRVMRTPA